MFNRELILIRKVDRLKWYMSTDKLDHNQKKVFIKGLVLEILAFYYGGSFLAIFHINCHAVRQVYMWTIVYVQSFYYVKILRLNEDEFDARMLNLELGEVKKLKKEAEEKYEQNN